MKKLISFLITIVVLLSISNISYGTDSISFDNFESVLLNSFEDTDNSLQNKLIDNSVEKSEPCDATINTNFSSNEVIVTMTRVQSRAKQQYSAVDFPDLEIENIRVILDYYPNNDNRLMLNITLKNSDKYNVLDAVKVLESYDNVYCVSPNYAFEDIEQESVNNQNFSINNYNLSPRYSSTDEEKEKNANLSTLACCAKKYTTPGINKKIAIGIIGTGIYSDSEAASKVIEYVDCTQSPYEEFYPNPYSDHTTIVANIIAREQTATMNSTHSDCGRIICSGTNNNIDLYSLSVITDTNGCYLDHYITAINYAIQKGIRVLSCSDLKSSTVRCTQLENALDSYDGVLISSATNVSNNAYNNPNIDEATNYIYPTSCENDNVIVVGNSNYDGTNIIIDSDSCYGRTKVDLFAPGYTYNTYNYNYGGYSGSSFATPRVAGAAAVLLSINNLLTPAQIKHYIMSGVNKSSNLTDKCVSGGSLNIYTSAKMLIGDMACDWETVFSGNFTDKNNMQVAAYARTAHNQMKGYVWTYNSSTGKFDDPIHWYTNDYYALNNDLGNNMYRIVAGDFDGDGYDEVCSLYDHDDYLFIQGTGFNCHPGYINLPVEHFTGRVVALDYDGDGKDEVAAFYKVPGATDHTKVYVWDFSGSKSSMTATQYLALDTGANMYNANCITGRVCAGDFDADGKDEIGAIYYYGPTTYSLHLFDFTGHTTAWRELIQFDTGMEVEKIFGRVVACDYNGDSRDEIVALYDNSSLVADGIINYGFCFTATDSWWSKTALYTSEQYIFRGELAKYLVAAGDFDKDGYEDVSSFYKLPAVLPSEVRGKIYISRGPNLYGYFTKWDPLA